ncbi:MAG: NTP transferase domain-containing protein [Chloroflexi bacterium]|nr:NTP transferase domain-containing protein [Chloroflexota bacterium]
MDDALDNYYAVIMAGGGGTRLWPLSRQNRPKQVLELIDNRSLFNIAVDRLEGLFPPDRIFVVTVREQAEQLIKLCPSIPAGNYLIEPFPRGTASVVGLAAIALQDKNRNAVMAVLTADHYIEDVSKFQKALKAGYQLSQQDYLVTLGIEPTFPSTGYGYIQRGEPIGDFEGLNTYRAVRFKEKPVLQDAQRFIAMGDHDWNSGMFIWKTSDILKEINRQMPDLSHILDEICMKIERPDWNQDITGVWGKIKPQTIDYGIMENAQNVAVIPVSDLGWNDVGSWDSLYDVLPADNDGNIIRHENFIGLDTKNSIVLSDETGRLIVTIGVENLILIDAGDALLVCSREKVQDVKEIVKKLKTDSRNQYL